MIILIAAMDQNGLIGKENGLPWPHLPKDMKRFKQITLNHSVVMGKKTFDTLVSPLPNRDNFVLTRSDWVPEKWMFCTWKTSLESILRMNKLDPEERIYVIGGADIYRQFLPHADKMELTHIHGTFRGDTYFPPYSTLEWKKIKTLSIEKDLHNPYSMDFTTYIRI